MFQVLTVIQFDNKDLKKTLVSKPMRKNVYRVKYKIFNYEVNYSIRGRNTRQQLKHSGERSLQLKTLHIGSLCARFYTFQNLLHCF